MKSRSSFDAIQNFVQMAKQVKQLKALLVEKGIRYDDCVEKADLVTLGFCDVKEKCTRKNDPKATPEYTHRLITSIRRRVKGTHIHFSQTHLDRKWV